jgi:hypothetical protein
MTTRFGQVAQSNMKPLEENRMSNTVPYNVTLIEVRKTPNGPTACKAIIRYARPGMEGPGSPVRLRSFRCDGRVVHVPPNIDLATIKALDMAGYDTLEATET